jgi:hypothetical protein
MTEWDLVMWPPEKESTVPTRELRCSLPLGYKLALRVCVCVYNIHKRKILRRLWYRKVGFMCSTRMYLFIVSESPTGNISESLNWAVQGVSVVQLFSLFMLLLQFWENSAMCPPVSWSQTSIICAHVDRFLWNSFGTPCSWRPSHLDTLNRLERRVGNSTAPLQFGGLIGWKNRSSAQNQPCRINELDYDTVISSYLLRSCEDIWSFAPVLWGGGGLGFSSFSFFSSSSSPSIPSSHFRDLWAIKWGKWAAVVNS